MLVYPQFPRAAAGDDGWTAYAAAHGRRTGVLVGPLFVVLVAADALLLLTRPTGVLAWAAAGCTAVVLAATALGAVPQHRVLQRRWDAAAFARLRRWDGVRAAAATVQVVVATALVAA